MMRIALGVEYDGAAYIGWQRQRHGVTVQEVVEKALSKIAAEPIAVTCAGRTDAGVHATQQVIHFDTNAERPMHAWLLGGNSNLPPGVSFRWAEPVPETFNARFSALSRAYRYVLMCHRLRPGLNRDRVAWTYKQLDAERMHEAGQVLLGEQDFTSYRAVACQAKHPFRRLDRLSVWRRGDFVYLDIEANAFLHHMVRNIAGTLMKIGAGEAPVSWAGEVLAAKDRTAAGVTAPAGGLYLVKVVYPPEYGLPESGSLPVLRKAGAQVTIQRLDNR
ncbi:tRNA pseudouridine(38-40) synthase TruA [Alkalilimnicola ehrlichii]|uniref:tRNA pseudouridine synthase A n=1 Tax=Alkalilimnicola ehrlichii TaxID=351052 RepID=A0A3E0X097_9GAMM|nr:tRNA pseudouridine(38-40) synthase TruA [Alkalilimnicola ehrlichii]RFA30894.1 tRNA pseudouridine(38-40) synthase TruA [Alkalilimnicola ehrlichii]RFA38844.1 tRNA pseudouridine(38-40) synthase TruA [Alkalilimnicola ehrlichii]